MRTLLGLFHLTDHLIPVIITLVIIAAIVVFWIGKPYLKYTFLVQNADSPDGVEKLAKALATEAGAKKVETSSAWESFIEAAQKLRLIHLDKVDELTKTDQ